MEESLKSGRDTEPILLWLDEVDSTNRYAREHFDSLDDATLILANSQTAGRGRKGRRWISPPGVNIYASFVVKQWTFTSYKASWIASLATIDTLRETACKLDLWLKWPNDIYCGRKKMAGILCETCTDKNSSRAGIIAGIGVNLNSDKDTLNRIDQPAASILSETGAEADLKKFALALGKRLTFIYRSIISLGPDHFFTRWREESSRIVGKNIVLVRDDGHDFSGKIEGIDSDGAIIFLSDNGDRTRYLSGDVSLKV